MEQPPDPIVTGSFPAAQPGGTGQIPQTPGSDASQQTGAFQFIKPGFTGNMPAIPATDPIKITGSAQFAKPGLTGQIPIPGSQPVNPTGALPLVSKGLTGQMPRLPGADLANPMGAFPVVNQGLTGQIPQLPNADPSDLTGRLILSRTSTRLPVIIPGENKKKRATGHYPSAKRPAASKEATKRGLQKLDRRLTWYIVSAVGILTIVLGFVFTVPVNNGQQGSSTVAQSISNLITNGNSNVSSQAQIQKGSASTHFTPGYSAGTGGTGTRLFTNSSPWNVPIGANVQLDSNSSSIANELANGNHVPAMFSYGMPIYTSTASDPSYHVQDNGNDNTFEAYQPIHIPNDAAPSPGTDKWLFIYDKTRNLIFEMWDTSKNGNTWTTNTGDVYSPTGDGVLQVDGTPQGGNGASYFGGVITYGDIQRGYINHALSLASQYTSSDHRYPMVASDGHDGDIPMGARLQLDPSVNCNTLPGASMGEKMVCQALETYGGYMRDTGGVTLSMYFEGEDLNDPSRNPPNGSPGDPGRGGGVFGRVGLHDGADLGEIPWNRLRVLKAWNSFTALAPTSAPTLASASQDHPSAFSVYTTPLLALSAESPTSLGDLPRKRFWRLAQSTSGIVQSPHASSRVANAHLSLWLLYTQQLK